MNKLEFIAALGSRLSGFPEREVEERIAFYLEMIDDRMEEGLSEAEAVAAVGSPDAVAAQIMAEIPLSAMVMARIGANHRVSWWEITLIVLGFPIWFSLLATLFSVLVSLSAALWSLVVSAWASFASFAGSALGTLVACCVLFFVGEPLVAFVMLAATFALVGLAILAFFCSLAATKSF